MEDFKIGDVVTLKSGSPKMTIHDIEVWVASGGGKYDKSYAKCVWFDGPTPRQQDFKKETLIASS